MLSKIQNILIPSFLKRLDFWLMTHKPYIWRTRGHFVVFYCLIAALLLYIGGTQYPQNFADFYDMDVLKSNGLVATFTYFLGFTSIGIFMWWWHSIQKFGYKRTNIVHFLTEIGIYTLGVCAISVFVFGFEKGFTYRQAFQLEKNSREDSVWVVQNYFFQYGYLPHFQPNKEANLTAYFKEGETLSQKMAYRESVVANLIDDETDPHDKYKYSRAQGSTDAFSLSHWEYPKNEKLYARPPQYKTPADYVNKILTNDTFWKEEEKRLKFKEDYNASREFFTDMTPAEITNMIDDVYPKYFRRINYFGHTQAESRNLVKEWMDKRLFLESLSEQEIALYKQYLSWLKTTYALYAPQPIIAFEKNAGQGFCNKRNSDVDYKITNERFINSFYIGSYEYFDENKGELAGEKLLHFLEKLDLESFNYYVKYLQGSGFQDEVKANKKNPQYKPSCQNYFKQYTPKSSVDSLYHYDFFNSNDITEQTWLNIIAAEYAQYVAHKYSEKDYQRLKNMMQVNSFENVTLKSKNTTIQQLFQLHQVENYSHAISEMKSSRNDYATKKQLTFSFFALTYCFLFAIFFYIITLSSGVQFWVSAFISGFFAGLLVFMRDAMPRFGRYTSYPQFNDYQYSPTPSIAIYNVWNQFLMILFGILLLVLALVLLFKKAQMSRAHIWFNIMIASSLMGLLGAVVYWQEVVEIKLRTEHDFKEYYSMPFDEKIRLCTLIFICAIGIYLFLTWLFKRHLTFPKKR
jgi:hypothetical protein